MSVITEMRKLQIHEKSNKFSGPRLLTKTNPTEIEDEFPDGEAASVRSDDSIFKASHTRLQSVSTTDPDSTFYSAEDTTGSRASLPGDERGGSNTTVKTLGGGGSMTMIKGRQNSDGSSGKPKPRLNRGSTGSTDDNPNTVFNSENKRPSK